MLTINTFYSYYLKSIKLNNSFMKRTILYCFLLAWAVLNVHADSKETVQVNGNVVNKFATRMTFSGDDVTLTFEDGTSQTELLTSVNIGFNYVAVFNENNYDNLKTIKTFGGKVVGVEASKTLKSGEWSSICLPFDIPESSISEIFGEGTIIATMDEGAPSHINYSTVNDIKSGIPYIIKPGKDVNKIECSDVLVSNMSEGNTIAGEAYDFIGTLNATTPAVGGYMFTSGNYVSPFMAGESMDALGAYLISPNGQQKMAGDVNGDGSLSVSDVTAMVNYVLGISVDNFDISVSDLDGNNEISVADIMQLVTMILDGITPSSFTITIDGESSGLNIR